MIAAARLAGVWSAVITPVDERYEPDAGRATRYYNELLGSGIDGINLLGTSGEAMSLSVAQRLRLMEAVAASVPRERTMCGTGAASLADAVQLTRAAGELGFAASLVMPPFYYRDVTGEGVMRFFDALLNGAENAPQILLYNFPKMSGITFNADLVDRLLTAFPGRITGMKDSSNDVPLQTELLARHSHLRIFPGAESALLEAKRRGAAGCISGSVALWPQQAQRAYAHDDETAAAHIRDKRADVPGGYALITYVRQQVAKARNDDAWLHAIPPG
jgi:4-hydroxy-tetrahydrodipicolinate synthase